MNTAAKVLIAGMVCLALQGCDFLYWILHKEGAQEKALVGEVLPFEKNSKVKEIQTLLDLYGYNPGSIDGVMGMRTRDAVERFQRENGLKESRFVDQQTWEKLVVFKENQLIIDDQLNIKLIQTILEKAGFDPGTIDGKMGPKMKKAVTAFQKSRGLKPDGKIGYKTLMKLAEFLPGTIDNAVE